MTRRTWAPPKPLLPNEGIYINAKDAADKLDVSVYALARWAMHGYVQQYYFGLMPKITYYYERTEIDELHAFLEDRCAKSYGEWSTWSKTVALRERYVN